MNNKLKKLTIIFFTFLFAIFFLNILIKETEIKNSDITNLNIFNYIPSNYDHMIVSNLTNNNIRKYIDRNISEEKREKLNIIKDGIISYLGFDLQEKIEDIYNNEFALTFFEDKLKNNDILLIFKLKKNKDVNHIINIGEELNKSDQIIELKRYGKLNYISHILKTKDNYIIASSNKKLIESSIQSKNHSKEIFSKESMPDDINLKDINLISSSKYFSPKNKSKLESEINNQLITIISSEDNKIKLRAFTPNINQLKTLTLNNQVDDVKDIIYTNKHSTYMESMNFLYNNIKDRKIIEEIFQEVNEELLFITKNDNWVLCFNNKLPYQISIDQFNFLKKYKKEDLYTNNLNYSIYTNDRLEIKNNNIIYIKNNPIFSLKDETNTYISNDFDSLINIPNKINLFDQYLHNNSEINSYKYIVNDLILINYINNEQLAKYYKSLKNLQNLLNTKLFSFEDVNINISQIIPERHEKVYLESKLKIL